MCLRRCITHLLVGILLYLRFIFFYLRIKIYTSLTLLKILNLNQESICLSIEQVRGSANVQVGI